MMHRFIKTAVENMERVEFDHDRDRPNPALRYQWTQEAIAYALIAIAETLQCTENSRLDALEARVSQLASNVELSLLTHH